MELSNLGPEISTAECVLRYFLGRLGFSMHVIDEHVEEIRNDPHIVLDCIPTGTTAPTTQAPVAHPRQVMEHPSSASPRVHFAFLMSKIEKDRLHAQAEAATQDTQEKDQQIATLNTQLQAATHDMQEKDQQIAALLEVAFQDTQEKDQQIATLNTQLQAATQDMQEKDQQIATLNAQRQTATQDTQEKDQQIAMLNAQLQAAASASAQKLREEAEKLEAQFSPASTGGRKRQRTHGAAGRADKGKRRAVTPNTATGEGSASATATRRGQRVPAGALKIRSEEGGRWRKATAVQFDQKGDDQRYKHRWTSNTAGNRTEWWVYDCPTPQTRTCDADDNVEFLGVQTPSKGDASDAQAEFAAVVEAGVISNPGRDPRIASINTQLTRTNVPLTTGRLILRCQALEDDMITWKPVAVYEHLPTKGEVELHFSKAEFEGLSGGYTLTLREPGIYVLLSDKRKEIQMRDIVHADHVGQ
eukprot:g4860.t1